MLSLLWLFLAASQPADTSALGSNAQVSATIEHSEWCAPAHVDLDLRTGKYAFLSRAPRRACRQFMVGRRLINGTLSEAPLSAVRAAYLRAKAQGLEVPECKNGGRPKQLWITNAGVPLLELANGDSKISAPAELGCWTDAAWSLQKLLDELFRPLQARIEQKAAPPSVLPK